MLHLLAILSLGCLLNPSHAVDLPKVPPQVSKGVDKVTHEVSKGVDKVTHGVEKVMDTLGGWFRHPYNPFEHHGSLGSHADSPALGHTWSHTVMDADAWLDRQIQSLQCTRECRKRYRESLASTKVDVNDSPTSYEFVAAFPLGCPEVTLKEISVKRVDDYLELSIDRVSPGETTETCECPELKQRFTGRYRLPSHCVLDKIEASLSVCSEEDKRQCLRVLVPKEADADMKTVDIPIRIIVDMPA